VPDELSRAEADAFLREQLVGRVGCHARGETYVVPVFFAYDGESVFVQTVEGRKVQLMRANPQVCFEADDYDRATGSWRSAIVEGRYEEVSGEDAERGLALLRERFASLGRPAASRRPDAGGRRPVAFRIQADRVTGRSVSR
jgi:nitroimidazol reductase NimA-like FMN-containing flavoprotein (pyridoxamine 5'-phosphate oxidase superfamily)